jgi:hypothetical protein
VVSCEPRCGRMNRLITDEFDDTGATVYTDKAFTSITLAKLLAQRRIALLGMLRTSGRPKNRKLDVDADGAANYWPFRHYSKEEMETYARGYKRTAFSKLAAGDIEWLMAELWADARWVTLLGTNYLCAEETTVRRWTEAARARLPVST